MIEQRSPLVARDAFPLLAGRDIAYLDSAASAQKPKAVLDRMRQFYETSYANIHRAVYPLSGNESVLGHDLMGEKAGDKEAQAAIDRGTMIMAGPFTLVQGGQGIAGRLPVYLNGSFWGIVSVTLNYPEALSGLTAPSTVASQGFACRIWRVNPDTGEEQTILKNGVGIAERALDYEFPIYNSEWHVTVSPVQPWYTNDSVI